MFLLAQASGSGAETVPQLAGPPALSYYILENPWPLTIGLAICGVVAMLILQRRGQPRQARIACILALTLAAIVAGLGVAITTPREVLRARTRELVALTAQARVTELRELLTEKARVGAFGSYFPGVRGREEVLASVNKYLGQDYRLASHEIGPVQAVVDGPNMARTQVRVWVKLNKDQEMYGGSIGAWFRIDWMRDGDGPWHATSISIMQIDFLGPNKDFGQ